MELHVRLPSTQNNASNLPRKDKYDNNTNITRIK